jgi:hypothetical protein
MHYKNKWYEHIHEISLRKGSKEELIKNYDHLLNDFWC